MSDMTLIDFLKERIVDDEAVDRWGNPYNMQLHAADCQEFTSAERADALCTCDGPNRWRAECAAKQRILEMHAVSHECPSAAGGTAQVVDGEACETLRHLGSAYAHHPDYREEWRP